MPPQAVLDLFLHDGTLTLFAATHGRGQWKLDVGGLPVGVGGLPGPSRLALSVPAPNPARGDMRFMLDVPAGGAVSVDVFDAVGRRVRRVFAGSLGPGSHAMPRGPREPPGAS